MKREKGKGIKAWEITEELREKAEPLIPQRKRIEGKTYQRKAGGGRKPIAPRKVLEGIFFVLRTGIQWKALPKEYGAASSVHQYFSEWAEAGCFKRLWEEGLLRYDEGAGRGWEWQRVDGCRVKAPLAREAVGNNPTDRGKKGTKRSLAVESHGLPIGIVLDGAHRHDIKLLEQTLQSIVTAHPEGMGRCLAAGYTGGEAIAVSMGYIPPIRPRGEENRDKRAHPSAKARRWVVEVCHAWFNRFRKLLVRYEKKARNYLALVTWLVPLFSGVNSFLFTQVLFQDKF